ncbi:MAG: hypothetical protein CMH83_16700 [Nocardioides sp.]|nr:hypothetical protein [Nocardioides sp.]
MLLLLRAAALWTVATLLVPAIGAWALADPAPSSPALATYVVRVAGVALVACAVWAWLVVTTVLGEQVAAAHGRRVRCRWVPAGTRRVALALLGGAALSLGAAVGPAGAHADPAPAPPGETLPLPERLTPPRSAPAPSETPAVPAAPAPSPTAHERVHVVVPGDSLWRVAEHALPRRHGTAPTPAEVLDLVRRLHRTNRAVVGHDPDLVHPGQRLRVPRVQP